MKRLFRPDNIFTLFLLYTFLLGLPENIFSFSKPMGVISIFKEDSYNSGDVKINGIATMNDQTVTSPCLIETPFKNSDITIYSDKAGLMNFGADTKMNLSFDESEISGALLSGRLTVLLMPAVTLNVHTRDGVVKVIGQNQKTNIAISYVNGKTQVKAFSGSAFLNNVSIAEGQYFIAGGAYAKNLDPLESPPFSDYFVNTIGVIISSIMEGSNPSDSNVDNMQTNVGPVR